MRHPPEKADTGFSNSASANPSPDNNAAARARAL